jgi:hypothetical protein
LASPKYKAAYFWPLPSSIPVFSVAALALRPNKPETAKTQASFLINLPDHTSSIHSKT